MTQTETKAQKSDSSLLCSDCGELIGEQSGAELVIDGHRFWLPIKAFRCKCGARQSWHPNNNPTTHEALGAGLIQ